MANRFLDNIRKQVKSSLEDNFGLGKPGAGFVGQKAGEVAQAVAKKLGGGTVPEFKVSNAVQAARTVGRTVVPPTLPGSTASPLLANVLYSPEELESARGKQRLAQQSLTRPGTLTQDQKLQARATLSENVMGLGGIISPVTKLRPQTATYVQELKAAQQAARQETKLGPFKKALTFLVDTKRRIVDGASPIEDVLYQAQKKGKYEVLPSKRIDLQVDRVLRAKNLAGQFAKDNGLEDLIKVAPDLDELDQYLIAKQAKRVEELGKKTGRDLARDEQLIQDLAPTYEPHAQVARTYSQKLLDYVTEGGLVSRETAEKLKQQYPDYVPLNRIFNETEEELLKPNVGTRPIASVGRQGVVLKLKGSEREIASPIESLMGKTVDAFEQVERNKAAQMLASYKDLPGNPFNLKQIPDTETIGPRSTISVLRNGVKEVYETDPIIAEAAKRLSRQQLGIIGQVLAFPVRVVKAGATGLNIPFVVANVVKDQGTAFVQSNRAAQTSLLNPKNFIRALWSALKHDDLYDDLVRNAGGGTSFDMLRNEIPLTVKKIRAGRSLGSKVRYTVTTKGELLTAIENIIGRSEEVTRVQQFKGTYDQLIREGRTPSDAKILAGRAARENTVNFARQGDWGNVLNSVFPYMNAGIQGARVTVRNFAQRPAQTTAKVVTAIFTPVAAVTAWNLSDPERRKAYEDIQDYEKENNLVIVPPNPTQDEKGRWNVIKVPAPQGTAGLANIVRRSMEAANGLDPVRFGDIASQLLKTTTSIDASDKNALASQFTPQITKPFVEGVTNTNLFTGNKIVPDSMKDLPPEYQVRDTTSGTARAIGKLTNTSPLKVENFVGTAGAGVGRQVLNLSDRTFTPNQVGGQDVVDATASRFTKARGGVEADKIYEEEQKRKTQVRLNNMAIKQKIEQAIRQQSTDLLLEAEQLDPKNFKKFLKEVLEKQEEATLNPTEKAIRSLPQSEREKYAQQLVSEVTGNLKPELESGVSGASAAASTSAFGDLLTQLTGDSRKKSVLSDNDKTPSKYDSVEKGKTVTKSEFSRDLARLKRDDPDNNQAFIDLYRNRIDDLANYYRGLPATEEAIKVSTMNEIEHLTDLVQRYAAQGNFIRLKTTSSKKSKTKKSKLFKAPRTKTVRYKKPKVVSLKPRSSGVRRVGLKLRKLGGSNVRSTKVLRQRGR